MHFQTASPPSLAHRPMPLSLAVPLPCNPPRRPWPRPLDPRRLRIPGGEAVVHCPDPRLPGASPQPAVREMLPC